MEFRHTSSIFVCKPNKREMEILDDRIVVRAVAAVVTLDFAIVALGREYTTTVSTEH